MIDIETKRQRYEPQNVISHNKIFRGITPRKDGDPASVTGYMLEVLEYLCCIFFSSHHVLPNLLTLIAMTYKIVLPCILFIDFRYES